MYIYVDTYMYVEQKSCLQYAHQYSKHYFQKIQSCLQCRQSSQIVEQKKKKKRIACLQCQRTCTYFECWTIQKQKSDFRIHMSHELYAWLYTYVMNVRIWVTNLHVHTAWNTKLNRNLTFNVRINTPQTQKRKTEIVSWMSIRIFQMLIEKKK